MNLRTHSIPRSDWCSWRPGRFQYRTSSQPHYKTFHLVCSLRGTISCSHSLWSCFWLNSSNGCICINTLAVYPPSFLSATHRSNLRYGTPAWGDENCHAPLWTWSPEMNSLLVTSHNTPVTDHCSLLAAAPSFHVVLGSLPGLPHRAIQISSGFHLHTPWNDECLGTYYRPFNSCVASL